MVLIGMSRVYLCLFGAAVVALELSTGDLDGNGDWVKYTPRILEWKHSGEDRMVLVVRIETGKKLQDTIGYIGFGLSKTPSMIGAELVTVSGSTHDQDGVYTGSSHVNVFGYKGDQTGRASVDGNSPWRVTVSETHIEITRYAICDNCQDLSTPLYLIWAHHETLNHAAAADIGYHGYSRRGASAEPVTFLPNCPMCWEIDLSGQSEPGACRPIDDCNTVECGAENIVIKFDPRMFGENEVSGADDMNDVDNGVWSTIEDFGPDELTFTVLTCKLGDCNMVATENGDNIDFTVRLSRKEQTTSIEDIVLDLTGPDIFVNFVCEYPSSFSVSTTVSVDSTATEGSVAATSTDGLKSKFTLQVFDNDELSAAVDSILIGSIAYVQAEWEITQSLVMFHLSDCTISDSGTNVLIVKETCYSSTLSAAPIGERQALKTVAYMFKMFNIPGSSGKATVSCTIKLCTASDSDCVLKDGDSNPCPDNAGYNYIPKANDLVPISTNKDKIHYDTSHATLEAAGFSKYYDEADSVSGGHTIEAMEPASGTYQEIFFGCSEDLANIKLGIFVDPDELFDVQDYQRFSFTTAKATRSYYTYASRMLRSSDAAVGFSETEDIYLGSADFYDCQSLRGGGHKCQEISMDTHRMSVLVGGELWRCGASTKGNAEGKFPYRVVIYGRI